MANDEVVHAIKRQFNEESADLTNPKQVNMLRQKYGLRPPEITAEERYWIRYFDEEHHES